MKKFKSNLLINTASTIVLAGSFFWGSTVFALELTDVTKPEITLKGDPVMTIERFSVFVDPGVNALDNQSGIERVVTVGEVDSSTPNTLHILSYTAYDNEGNSASVTRTVNVVDTTSPSKVTNLAVTTTLNSAVLTWNLPDDKDFVSINVYRSEVPGEIGKILLAGFKSNKVTDSGLSDGKTYYYSIETVDDQGLISPIIGISATTLSSAPLVSNAQNISSSIVEDSKQAVPVSAVKGSQKIESENQEVLGSNSENETDSNNSIGTFLGKKIYGLFTWFWAVIIMVVGALTYWIFYIKSKK
jgi:hypothetical protein